MQAFAWIVDFHFDGADRYLTRLLEYLVVYLPIPSIHPVLVPMRICHYTHDRRGKQLCLYRNLQPPFLGHKLLCSSNITVFIRESYALLGRRSPWYLLVWYEVLYSNWTSFAPRSVLTIYCTFVLCPPVTLPYPTLPYPYHTSTTSIHTITKLIIYHANSQEKPDGENPFRLTS